MYFFLKWWIICCGSCHILWCENWPVENESFLEKKLKALKYMVKELISTKKGISLFLSKKPKFILDYLGQFFCLTGGKKIGKFLILEKIQLFYDKNNLNS